MLRKVLIGEFYNDEFMWYNRLIYFFMIFLFVINMNVYIRIINVVKVFFFFCKIIVVGFLIILLI